MIRPRNWRYEATKIAPVSRNAAPTRPYVYGASDPRLRPEVSERPRRVTSARA